MNSTWIEYLPDWYLEWCWRNEELQSWWVTTWPSDDCTPFGSNVNVGDRFTLGSSRQACVVYSKTLNIGGAGGVDHVAYQIGGDRGGHWYAPRHDEPTGVFVSGHARFIPTIDQLQRLGFTDVARRLLDDVAVIGLSAGCRCLTAYRERRGEHAPGCPMRAEEVSAQ